MSGLRSPRPSGSASRLSPELVPAILAVVLLAAAGAQFAMPAALDLPRVAHAKPAKTASADDDDDSAGPAAPARPAYRAIMAHPIFAPDRAPPPAEAEASSNLSGVEVLGTAIAGKTAAAALLRESDGTFARVKVGEEIEGWKLVSIAPDELVFDRNGERRSLQVDTEKLKASAPKAGVRPGMPGQVGSQAPIGESSDDEEDDDDE